jgi:hypothetical protein
MRLWAWLLAAPLGAALAGSGLSGCGPARAAAPDPPQWRVLHDTDAQTGVRSVLVTLGSDTADAPAPASLTLTCAPHGDPILALIIPRQVRVGADSLSRLQMRYDAAAPAQVAWVPVQHETAWLSPPDGTADPQVRALWNARSLWVESVDQHGVPFRAHFALDGAAAVRDTLRGACGWSGTG